jgi:hypothetical protein
MSVSYWDRDRAGVGPTERIATADRLYPLFQGSVSRECLPDTMLWIVRPFYTEMALTFHEALRPAFPRPFDRAQIDLLPAIRCRSYNL